MFDQLSERLQSTFAGFGRKREITDENMEEALREIRRAMLEADVSLRVIKAFLSRIKDRAVGEQVLKSVEPGQQLVKIVHDEMVALLGGENKPLDESGNPNIIVLFGLQGSGKTTTAGKLAMKLRKDGKKPLLVAADVYRPAAIQQLITLGKQIDIPVFTIEGSTDVLTIARSGVEQAKAEGFNPVIVDTAGRLQIDTDMMAELLLVERSLQPQEKLLVVDAMTGQEAVSVAETFNSQLDVTGIVMTKLDGDARGGAALSVVEVTGKPIKLIGTSEKLTGLEVFHPERMATRILGMGDVLSLVEKAQEAISLEEAQDLEKKMRKDEFSLEDFMKIQRQLKMLGSMEQILGMLPIPGLTKEMREMVSHGGEAQLKRVESMVNSMTVAERRKPELIKDGRLKRIANGCGMKEDEIKAFLVQFEQMRMIMKQLTRMTDGMKKEAAPPSGALKMPRSMKKKKKDSMSQMPGFPNMPGGGLPPGFPKGGMPPGFFGKGGGKFPPGF
ncbi:MAG TPA: signal recognition particle protein [Coleofasciculaceae cyanobacterium]|jgi:signal recognition particle subunit SRP54